MRVWRVYWSGPLRIYDIELAVPPKSQSFERQHSIEQVLCG